MKSTTQEVSRFVKGAGNGDSIALDQLMPIAGDRKVAESWLYTE